MWCTLNKTSSELWCKTINCHDLSSYYTAWTPNYERILNLCQNQHETLTYGRYPKIVIYPYGLGHCWWRLVAIGILNRNIIISHGIKIMCPFGRSKGHVIMKFVVIVISLVEFDICSYYDFFHVFHFFSFINFVNDKFLMVFLCFFILFFFIFQSQFEYFYHKKCFISLFHKLKWSSYHIKKLLRISH